MITSAALIMVCVFGSFILDGDPIVKEFGVGLAVAIAIDATVVRCMLVPAVMALMGRAAWWLPAWLGRLLPRISVEGEFGSLRIEVENIPTENPRTGRLSYLSTIALLRDLGATLRIGT